MSRAVTTYTPGCVLLMPGKYTAADIRSPFQNRIFFSPHRRRDQSRNYYTVGTGLAHTSSTLGVLRTMSPRPYNANRAKRQKAKLLTPPHPDLSLMGLLTPPSLSWVSLMGLRTLPLSHGTPHPASLCARAGHARGRASRCSHTATQASSVGAEVCKQRPRS